MKEEKMKTIAESIKKARKNKGYSQKRLSMRTGIPQTTIANWETGASFPTVINLIPIADALGVTLDELVGRSKNV